MIATSSSNNNQNNNIEIENKEQEKEDEIIKGLLRPLILRNMGKYGSIDIKNKDINKTIFIITMLNGTEIEFNLLKQFYLNAIDPADKQCALQSLDYINNNKLKEYHYYYGY